MIYFKVKLNRILPFFFVGYMDPENTWEMESTSNWEKDDSRFSTSTLKEPFRRGDMRIWI